MQKETMELLEQNVQDSLRKVNELEIGDDNRPDAVKEACQLVEKLLAAEHESNSKMAAQRNRSIETRKVKLDEDRLKYDQEKSEAVQDLEKSKVKLEQDRLEFDQRKSEGSQAIDRERIAVEQEKNEMPAWKMALEVAKIAVPVVSGVMSIIAYDKFQKRMFDFEENGRICSTAGRELHLPKFWK